MVVFGQNGGIREKVVVIGQKWLISSKIESNSSYSLLMVKVGCIWANLLYSGKLAVFGQKWLYSGK